MNKQINKAHYKKHVQCFFVFFFGTQTCILKLCEHVWDFLSTFLFNIPACPLQSDALKKTRTFQIYTFIATSVGNKQLPVWVFQNLKKALNEKILIYFVLLEAFN